MNEAQTENEISMNPDDMWQEATFTDNAVGTLRRLTPVTASGENDASRSVRFMGSTQVMTNAGPLPLQFEIDADSLDQAIAGFGPAATIAFEQTMEELREYQRQQASSIVVPKGGANSGGMGGMGGVGGLGGGNIQIP